MEPEPLLFRIKPHTPEDHWDRVEREDREAEEERARNTSAAEQSSDGSSDTDG